MKRISSAFRCLALALLMLGVLGSNASLLAAPALSPSKSPTSANSQGIGTKTVRAANEKLSAMLRSKKGTTDEKKLLQQARDKLGGFLDIAELGKRAMKDHWSSLSAAQRTEFSRLLRDLIETNYVRGLRANVQYQVRYLGEESQGEHLLVKTIIESERHGRPTKIAIDYLLSQSNGAWRTYDIRTDGIGLVENYRAMFNKIIGKSKIDGLLKRMRKKLASM